MLKPPIPLIQVRYENHYSYVNNKRLTGNYYGLSEQIHNGQNLRFCAFFIYDMNICLLFQNVSGFLWIISTQRATKSACSLPRGLLVLLCQYVAQVYRFT